jgi:S-adenosylmethionine:tRNA ribosyltransferase-isomerase
VDVLMTNFHLPRSTLMALVAAGLGGDGAAVERLKSLYELAMESGYRFYSFGDAMLVLP